MSATHLHRPPLPHLAADQLWALVTLALAAVAVVLGVVGAYEVGAVVALVCVLCGGWSMYVSETIAERFQTVVATVLGAVALITCLAYGSDVPSTLLM